MRNLPTGTVTFLFTDIEGSTKLLLRAGEEAEHILDQHAVLMREAIAEGDGVEVRTEGDAFFVAYRSALGAVTTTVAAQRALARHEWPDGCDVRVRMGMHTGAGVAGGDDYVGLDVHRAARIAAAAHGGQVVLSETTAMLVRHDLPDGVKLRELGSFRLKDLPNPERISQLVIGGLPNDFPRLASLDTAPPSLPTEMSSFIGREQELAGATEMLGRTRLLTLTGPGGTGKTRLAVRLASEVANTYKSGVFFTPLAAVKEPAMIGPAVLQSMHVATLPSGVEPWDHLLGLISDREVLLVLDNFEQLLDSAPMVGEILQASPGSKIVVTSRAPLHITGEQEMTVPPLALPAGGTSGPEHAMEFEAVKLFVERARAVDSSFTLDDESAPAVTALVGRLDGLPLAIELAASRVKLLSPAAILEHLGTALHAGGMRDLPARQQTLRDTIAWSYDLLDEVPSRVFERFSVFAGEASLNQIEAVCGSGDAAGRVLDALMTLVDHSLLVRVGPAGGGRFGMLQTIRDHAAEHLAERGEEDDARRRHAAAFLHLAQEAKPELTGRNQARWLARLSLEEDNLNDALTWALESGDAETAHEMVGALWRYWHMRGHQRPGRARAEAALELSDGPPEGRARALEAAGGLAYWSGDAETTQADYQEALAIWRAIGDQSEIANALYNLSFPVMHFEGPEGATPLLDEARKIFTDTDDRVGLGRVAWQNAGVEVLRGDLEGGIASAQASLGLFDENENPFDYGWALFTLATYLYLAGRADEGRSSLLHGFRLFVSVGDISAVIVYLAGLAELARLDGDEERAFCLAGILHHLREETGIVLLPDYLSAAGQNWLRPERLSAVSGRSDFKQGMEMSFDEAVEYALSGSE